MLLYEIKDFLLSLFFFQPFFQVLQPLKLLRKVSVLSLIVLTIYPQDCPLEFYNKFTHIRRETKEYIKTLRIVNSFALQSSSGFVKIVRGRFLRGRFLTVKMPRVP